MSDCPKCYGLGIICDRCGDGPNPSRYCETCEGHFCAFAKATVVSTGEPSLLGIRDCFKDHDCKAATKEPAA